MEQENFRWVEDLLAAGADIQVLDSDGWNVIHCAAFRSYLEMLVRFSIVFRLFIDWFATELGSILTGLF